MALPALRQPKIISQERVSLKREGIQNVILTLKGEKNVVISSDAYHGIVNAKGVLHCVFCRSDLEPNEIMKEAHKLTDKHLTMMKKYPHVEDLAGNLVRKLDEDNFYCTPCNVTFSTPFLARHLTAYGHIQELEKAEIRASAYGPPK